MSHSVYNLPGKTTRQKLARVPLVSVLKKIRKQIWILLMFALNCKFKQHFTVNISCFETGFISLFFKGNENKYLYYISVFNFSQIQDARNCSTQSIIYFVATVWWGNLHCISELVVANKWWKSLVTLSVIKKCLLKAEDKYLCKMLHTSPTQ